MDSSFNSTNPIITISAEATATTLLMVIHCSFCSRKMETVAEADACCAKKKKNQLTAAKNMIAMRNKLVRRIEKIDEELARYPSVDIIEEELGNA